MSRQSAGEWRLVSRNAYYERLSVALGLFVGRGRRYSVKQLSNATGVPDRVIEDAKYDPGHSQWRAMPIECIASLQAFLGAAFTSELIAPDGQGAFDLPDDDSPDPARVACEAVEDAADLARIARGGGVAYQAADRSAVATIAQRKITRGQQLLSLAHGGVKVAA